MFGRHPLNHAAPRLGSTTLRGYPRRIRPWSLPDWPATTHNFYCDVPDGLARGSRGKPYVVGKGASEYYQPGAHNVWKLLRAARGGLAHLLSATSELQRELLKDVERVPQRDALAGPTRCTSFNLAWTSLALCLALPSLASPGCPLLSVQEHIREPSRRTLRTRDIVAGTDA